MPENYPIKRKVKWTVIIITVLLIINTFWLNIAFRHQLYIMGLQFIYDYQQNGNGFTSVVYNIFSLITGTQLTVAILIILVFLTFRMANTLILIMYVSFNVWLMAILKMAFVDLRPTWETDLIQQLQWKCEYSYGFPSGHIWIVMLLHYPIVTDIIGTGSYKLLLLWPLILLICGSLSRLYLGSHSSDQVLSSLVYSFGFAVLYKYQIQRLLWRLFSYFLRTKIILIPFICTFILQVLLFVPAIILYEVNVRNNRLGGYYLGRLNSVCGQNYTLQSIQGRQASEAAVGNVVFAVLYSILLIKKQVFEEQSRRLRIENYFNGKWNYGEKKIRNFILKILLYLIPGVFFLGIFFYLIPIYVDNFYGDYFLMTFAWMATVLYWVVWVPQLAFKYKIIEQDIQKVSKTKIQIPQNQHYFNSQQIPTVQSLKRESTGLKRQYRIKPHTNVLQRSKP